MDHADFSVKAASAAFCAIENYPAAQTADFSPNLLYEIQ
ncbi:hypothetical protein M2105_005212 [Paenibacillus sp. PastF-1]|nr:hypothetical protein [Paenibacillus sp. PastF-1]